MQNGTTNNNTNAGNTNTTNTGLVRPAGNEITINGTNKYNTGVAPSTGVVRNTTNAPVQPTAGRTAITR